MEETHRGMERTRRLQVVLMEDVFSFLQLLEIKQQDDGIVYI